MHPVDEERGAARRGLGGMTCQTRNEQGRAGREERAADREQLGDRTLLPLRPVEPERDRRSDDEERKAQLEPEEAATESRVADER